MCCLLCMAVGKIGPDGKMGPTLGDCLVQFQVEVDGVVHICEVCMQVGVALCSCRLSGSIREDMRAPSIRP